MGFAHGFFQGRRALKLARHSSGKTKAWASYLNISPVIATLVSCKLATLYELQTVYGTQDAYDLLEINAVDDYNRALANEE
jgi:hypothetical protein